MDAQARNPVLPSDVCLLLRADAEQCWLHREVIPVLREVEARGRLADEEVGAALAYLEAMWDEAVIRARATDAAHASLSVRADGGDEGLGGKAGRYHAAVRALRELVRARVAPFMADSADCGEHADDCLLGPDGCAPRAA
jgi:hypothetical protein